MEKDTVQPVHMGWKVIAILIVKPLHSVHSSVPLFFLKTAVLCDLERELIILYILLYYCIIFNIYFCPYI